MKHPTVSTVLAACLLGTLSGQITYFDAPSSSSGTTQENSGLTAVWQQFDGVDWVAFDDSLTARAYTSGNWELRLTGPATNAAGTTAYQVGDGDITGGRDAAQIRVIVSGFNPDDSISFSIYNIRAAGVAAIQSAVTTDAAATGLYAGLTTFSSGGVPVLPDGSEGSTSGDQRIRYDAFSGLTGSDTYVIVLDDFDGAGPGDRATLDGFGVEATPAGTAPEFGVPPETYYGAFGDTFTLTYPAVGNPAPGYQWQFSPDDLDPWTDLPGEVGESLEFVNAQPDDLGFYRVVATNTAGTVTSPSVYVDLIYPTPEVSIPAKLTGFPGENLTVTATATGIGALSYEWHKIDGEGDTVLAETSDTLSFTPFTEADAAIYYVAAIDDGTGVTPADFPIAGYSDTLLIVKDPGPIAYFDAPSGNSGTTQLNAGVTAVWQQFDGVDWIDFDDSLSTRASNSGGWELRTTGPGANANSTTAYSAGDTSVDAAQIRVILSGLDPSEVLDFFVYNVRAAGAAKIQSLVTTDTAATGLYGDLTPVVVTTGNEPNVEQVLADGTPGDPGSGDRRFRSLVAAGLTGSSSYAIVFDDFLTSTVGDRTTLDGFGIAGLPPAPDFATWIGGYDVGTLTGFEDDADGDGLDNGLENYLGTDPSVANQGLTNVIKVGNTLTLQHPKNSAPAPDVAAAYLWSRDLSTWHFSGDENEGTTVTFSVSDNTPGTGIATVTATIGGTQPPILFTRIEVTPDP
ncbi:immunoglobulin domain-containing protein [Luteolibacter marinus]|uniref:immunoglobulin domain-containing protein n=1 Tax=Luteolibacter marinus TaxID=2776705 RepID=UPI0018695169|nr:immunoglobulin domain-containing protein [Luteolibacter marinus]